MTAIFSKAAISSRLKEVCDGFPGGQSGVAVKIGEDPSQVNRWCNGATIKAEKLGAIIAATGGSARYVMTGAGSAYETGPVDAGETEAIVREVVVALDALAKVVALLRPALGTADEARIEEAIGRLMIRERPE